MKYDNYIFDLYGTLIDVWTDEHAAQTWKKWLRVLDKKGIRHPDYITFRREFFDSDKRAREAALAEGKYEVPEIDVIPIYKELLTKYGNNNLDEKILNELSYDFRVASRKRIGLFPGVEEYLKLIHANGKKAYILSNAQASYTWPEIQMFHLEKLTDDVLMSSDYKCMKPDKAFFDILIERYSMDRDKTIMHGDSGFSDIQGAEKAGIASVHLANENHPSKYYINACKNQ